MPSLLDALPFHPKPTLRRGPTPKGSPFLTLSPPRRTYPSRRPLPGAVGRAAIAAARADAMIAAEAPYAPVSDRAGAGVRVIPGEAPLHLLG